MDNAVYATLGRQSGLLQEMQTIANNIANMSTAGFKSETLLFEEHIAALGKSDSLSMAHAAPRDTNLFQGGLAQTGGTFDLAIEGEGFFMIETPDGPRLTRAGNFTANAEGDLVTAQGFAVLGAGGAPVFVPSGAGSIHVGTDGTLSADGQPLGQIGVFMADEQSLHREDGVHFAFEGEPLSADNFRVLQGALEESNVDPVTQIARMIEVQRAYELGASFSEREDERIKSLITTLGR